MEANDFLVNMLEQTQWFVQEEFTTLADPNVKVTLAGKPALDALLEDGNYTWVPQAGDTAQKPLTTMQVYRHCYSEQQQKLVDELIARGIHAEGGALPDCVRAIVPSLPSAAEPEVDAAALAKAAAAPRRGRGKAKAKNAPKASPKTKAGRARAARPSSSAANPDDDLFG